MRKGSSLHMLHDFYGHERIRISSLGLRVAEILIAGMRSLRDFGIAGKYFQYSTRWTLNAHPSAVVTPEG